MTVQEKRTLIVQISDEGIETILGQNQKVTIVRSFPDSAEYCVVCASFAPDPAFPPYSVIFYPNWKVLAFPKSIDAFETLDSEAGAGADAVTGNNYVFTGTGFVSGTKNDIGVIGIENQSKSSTSLTAALGQEISIPGGDIKTNPVAVAAIISNNTFYFDPPDKIIVFTSTQMEDGTILPASLLQEKETLVRLPAGLMISRYLEIQLSNDCTTIHYDNKSHLFFTGEL